MTTATELVILDEDELAGRLGEARRELFNLRFQLATGQLDNSSRLGEVKREIARLLTVLRAREIAVAEGNYVAPAPAARAARDAAAASTKAAASKKKAEPEPTTDDENDDVDDVEDEA
jgi:large subunit ribosomal protein L29